MTGSVEQAIAAVAEGEAAPQGLSSESFRHVIGHFASGVTVITTTDDDAMYGTTASAVASLSLDPPMLVACMNRSSATGAATGRSRRFVVNILAEDHAELAARFAQPAVSSIAAAEQFEGVRVSSGLCGPLLEDALASLECRVVEEMIGGTHTVFLAAAERAAARPGAPLAYWCGRFGRLSLETDGAGSDRNRT